MLRVPTVPTCQLITVAGGCTGTDLYLDDRMKQGSMVAVFFMFSSEQPQKVNKKEADQILLN